MIDVTPRNVLRSRRLYFSSQLLVDVGTAVNPDTIIAKTMFPLPRLFFLNVFTGLPDPTGQSYIVNWAVVPGQLIDYQTTIASFQLRDGVVGTNPKPFLSPMTGTVDEIISEAGNLLLREFIDYDSRRAVVPLDRRLDIPSRLFRKFLLVRQGNYVEKGQTLAQQISPGKSNRIEAPIAGIVTEVDPQNHFLVIERRIEEVPTLANFYGFVKSADSKEVVIEGHGVLLNGKCGLGASSSGRLVAVKGAHPNPASVSGSVLLYRNSIADSDIQFAVEGGAKGIIAAGADHKTLSIYAGFDLAVAFTGKELVPFPIVLTEGFGKQEMQSDMFEYLAQNSGEWVFINGRTQLRAGVIRPEIIVFHNPGE